MFMINLEKRIGNKAFWIGIISLVVLLLQQLGLVQLADYIPKNYADIVNTVFAILTAFGIVADTSTSGYSDMVQAETVQAINQSEEVKAEATTTAINNTVSENSEDSAADNNVATNKETAPVLDATALQQIALLAAQQAIQSAVTGTAAQV